MVDNQIFEIRSYFKQGRGLGIFSCAYRNKQLTCSFILLTRKVLLDLLVIADVPTINVVTLKPWWIFHIAGKALWNGEYFLSWLMNIRYFSKRHNICSMVKNITVLTDTALIILSVGRHISPKMKATLFYFGKTLFATFIKIRDYFLVNFQDL